MHDIADLQVTADLVDGYGRPPHFEKTLYEVEFSEESEIGTCLLKVTLSFSQTQPFRARSLFDYGMIRS
ncbi:unnamed protein product [Strongylus vulgaris]|uniref:Cadherin domain-containing protein n=1 Tax=Strongylus vulgaris TaxID=40348 RepID=A0A3P7JES0_STRVU|nr:unnamed protein product [Strongylus vulgaris]